MKDIKHIHFLGIGGISQSALAIILLHKGYKVSGSDKTESKITKELKQKNIDVCINGISNQIKIADLIVFSVAIHNDDKEMILAKSLGKKIISRAELLGLIANEYKNVISIAGSHGKTTTTGMIAEIFIEAGFNPTVHIGGLLTKYNTNIILGNNDFFITEACEYYDSFLELKSDVSVVLNVQSDHMDYFKTINNLKKSFVKFVNNTKNSGLIVYNKSCNFFKQKIKKDALSYSCGGGIVKSLNITEYKKGKYSFDCMFLGQKLGNIKLGVYGEHNVENALSAICVALKYGVSFQTIKKALFNYCGVKRRFEDYGIFNGVRVIHDYAHHPTEIKAIINLAKRIVKGDLYVVFQPHTFSRTLALIDEFKKCFDGAKEVFVYKVYSAREDKSQGIDENGLKDALLLEGQMASSYNNYEEMKKNIVSTLKKGDLLLVLGAGDIESFCEYFGKNNN